MIGSVSVGCWKGRRREGLELDRADPGAAASLKEGMEETLTVTRLGITDKLKLTLQSTNPCESMIATVRVIDRNVNDWSFGEICLRWTAAGMLEAETRFQGSRLPRGLPTSRSQSNTTYSVTVNVTLTHHRRRRQQPSLCHITLGIVASVNVHDWWDKLAVAADIVVAVPGVGA